MVLIALLVVAGAWRIGRWHWRPRLRLPDDLLLERGADGTRVFLDVRNEGAARSTGCRALLVRCERRETVGWLRVDPHRALSGADAAPSGVQIPAGGVARVELDRVLPEVPGAYRLDIAVRNGEEKRSSYVVDVEAVSPGASP